jgi:uncharacterized membrane protein
MDTIFFVLSIGLIVVGSFMVWHSKRFEALSKSSMRYGLTGYIMVFVAPFTFILSLLLALFPE